MQRVSDSLFNVIDEYTGELASYYKVTEWWDGSSMNDSKADGVIFRKSGSEYFKRALVDNTLNFAWWGVKGDGGTTDNADLINDAINSIPDFTVIKRGVTFSFPRDKNYFYCSEAIILEDKNIHIIGQPNGGTQLVFPAGTIGIEIKGTFTDSPPILEKIWVSATAKDPDDGHVGGVRSEDPENYSFHGIKITQICQLIDVLVSGFSGHGIYIDGDIGLGTQASTCYFYQVKLENNYGCGLYIHGQDANQGGFYNLTVRNNGWWGIWDNSFLGNQFYAPHATTTGDYGHYCVGSSGDEVNARTNFFGWYGESNPNPSKFFSPWAVAFGGIHEAPIEGAGMWIQGALVNKTIWNKEGTNIGFELNASDYDDPSFVWKHDNSTLKLHSKDNIFSYGHFVQDDPETPYLWQVGFLYKYFNDERYFNGLLSHGFRHLVIGGKFIQCADSLTNKLNIPYFKGDVIYNNSFSGNNVQGWLCIQNGQTGSYSEGRTATADNSPYLAISGTTTVLKPGMTIVVNGTAATILYFSSTTLLFMDRGIPAGSGLTITYQTPKFKAFGTGIGTTTQRPTLTSDDAGWQYFDTDIYAWITWTGSAWQSSSSLAIIDDANYTVAVGISDVVYKTLTAARTITIPSASTNLNRKITIKHGGQGAFNINLSTSVKESSSTSVSSIAQSSWLTILSDGTDWWIVASK